MARLPHLVLVLATASVLAACGSSDNVAAPAAPPSTPTVTVKQEDQFGAAFAAAFRADPNAEPITPMDGDIIALSLTAEPVNLG
jgi:hypothetical protein